MALDQDRLQRRADMLCYWGPYSEEIETALASQPLADLQRGLWARHGSLWKDDERTAAEIERHLGWLDLPGSMRLEVTRLEALRREVRAAGLQCVVLLGMGGSAIAAEVLAAIFGPQAGGLTLTVLDTTDPDEIRGVLAAVPLDRTLFIVASKSGTTVEPLALAELCKAQLAESSVGTRWPRHMVAITDAGTRLDALARRENYRARYLNPPDVAGRYATLSLFGLVPAALIGLDLDRLLERARRMLAACGEAQPPQENPGLVLGAALGILARTPTGPRDKLTLITSPRLAPYSRWVEQLIAESTGKQRTGLLPLVRERLEPLPVSSNDRCFVYLRLAEDHNDTQDARVVTQVARGHPVMVIELADLYDVGAEFARWEFATAVLGKVLGVNPFDQPDVDLAKRRTQQMLARYGVDGGFETEAPQLEDGLLALYGAPLEAANTVDAYLRALFASVVPGDYIALLAYLARTPVHTEALAALQEQLIAQTGAPTTLGFGPRYLHSTGQYHKGGPNRGLFLVITQEHAQELPIPGRSYGFGALQLAQALGDCHTLRARDRRVVRIHLRGPALEGLTALQTALRPATPPARSVP